MEMVAEQTYLQHRRLHDFMDIFSQELSPDHRRFSIGDIFHIPYGNSGNVMTMGYKNISEDWLIP